MREDHAVDIDNLLNLLSLSLHDLSACRYIFPTQHTDHMDRNSIVSVYSLDMFLKYPPQRVFFL
jgi:hypothetical protein